MQWIPPADCGPSNPLSDLRRHLTSENISFQKHGKPGYTPDCGPQLFQLSPSTPSSISPSDAAMLHAFFDEDRHHNINRSAQLGSASGGYFSGNIIPETEKQSTTHSAWTADFLSRHTDWSANEETYDSRIAENAHMFIRELPPTLHSSSFHHYPYASGLTHWPRKTESLGSPIPEVDPLTTIFDRLQATLIDAPEAPTSSELQDGLLTDITITSDLTQEETKDTGNSDVGNFYQEDADPLLEEYRFSPNNPYLADPPSSLLDTAKTLFASSTSSLADVSLVLEAAIQQGDQGIGGYEAWTLLGEVEGMNECEEHGLTALQTALHIAESNPAGLSNDKLTTRLLLLLARAYANESYHSTSRSILKRWLHLSYPSFAPCTSRWKNINPWSSHMELMEGFLRAARHLHAQGAMDPDVQVALGILSYMNSEYGRAAECFGTALSAHPDNPSLWNHLGSCLLNDSKSEDALAAYRKALELRPTYIRAIYNIGIACLELGAHKEAVEHLLSAIKLQNQLDSGGSFTERSECILSTLRRSFHAMDRPDLVDLLISSDLEQFRTYGFEF